MTLSVLHKEISFGTGDLVRVSLRIKEGDKERTQIFEGMVIAIKNRRENRTFTVRRIGAGNVGIERIFPLESPFLEKVEVVKKGTRGARRSKLYFTRAKSPREVDEIFARALKREASKKVPDKKRVHAPKKK